VPPERDVRSRTTPFERDLPVGPCAAQVDDGDERTDQELTVEKGEAEDARRNFGCRS
jgi:hypothetical protein